MTGTMQQYVWENLSAERRRALLERPALKSDPELRQHVARILARVRADRDAALKALTLELDGVELDSLEVSRAELDRAGTQLSAAQKDAIRVAAANIRKFHEPQRPAPVSIDIVAGVRCERLLRPIRSVGLYVPAGATPLPSTALMLGVPAALAECPTRSLCSPPQADGTVDPAVLYVARLCGIERVFKLGGAQAIAAMAYGTETVPKADKIFGPGNAWVTAAKALVAEDPAGAARDLPAGPSEVMVIADAQADADFVAADLLSQAEHGPDSQALLVTTSAAVAARVIEEVGRQSVSLQRRTTVEQSLRHSSAIVVRDMRAALEVANAYAPEHLILQVEQPRRWLAGIEAAGSVFLGPWAPESIGDYCSGTNHVLPTYGFARAYSSLGLTDFLRAMTVQELTPEGFGTLGPVAETLATLEQLDAHAEAVRRRLAALSGARPGERR